MSEIVAVFGILIIGIGILGIVSPGTLTRFVSTLFQSRYGFYLAMALRLLLGIALIGAASDSHFPQTLIVLGVLAIVAAIAGPFIGFKRLRTLADWLLARPPVLIRAWAALAAGLGTFLVVAVS